MLQALRQEGSVRRSDSAPIDGPHTVLVPPLSKLATVPSHTELLSPAMSAPAALPGLTSPHTPPSPAMPRLVEVEVEEMGQLLSWQSECDEHYIPDAVLKDLDLVLTLGGKILLAEG